MIVLSVVIVEVNLFAVAVLVSAHGPVRGRVSDDRRLRGDDAQRGDEHARNQTSRTTQGSNHRVSYNPCVAGCQAEVSPSSRGFEATLHSMDTLATFPA